MNTLPPFSKTWYFFRLPKIRNSNATYTAFDYDSLPPLSLEKLDGSWKWLQEISEQTVTNDSLITSKAKTTEESFEDDSEEAQALEAWLANLQHIQEQAKKRNLTIPSSFIRLMQNPDWLTSIESPTDCFFELDNSGFIDLKDRPGECLLHFYSDSQYCLLWYLHFDNASNYRVVVSNNSDFQIYKYNYDQICIEYQKDAQNVIDTIEQGSHTFLWECAPDFESFIYRVWLEGTIWYATTFNPKPFSSDQQCYVDFYKKH